MRDGRTTIASPIDFDNPFRLPPIVRLLGPNVLYFSNLKNRRRQRGQIPSFFFPRSVQDRERERECRGDSRVVTETREFRGSMAEGMGEGYTFN